MAAPEEDVGGCEATEAFAIASVIVVGDEVIDLGFDCVKQREALPMYKHVLIATDGSELAAKAVTQGIGLAKSCNAKATILTVTKPFNSLGDKQHMFSGLPENVRQKAVDFLFEAANTTLKEAAKVADAAAIDYELKSVENENPFQAIVSTAEQDNCDLIVMASHGRSGLSKFFLGSETMKTLTHTRIPTLVCR